MDVPLLIKNRLLERGLDQKDLAAAAQVTESYISQLLARKKAPPAPGRTDIYEKIARFLELPTHELSSLAEVQRKEELRKKVADPPEPLFKDFRSLILRKTESAAREELRTIFARQPFGELERLVAQTLLGVAQQVIREESGDENWLHSVAQWNGQSAHFMHTAILDFLGRDVFTVTAESGTNFLNLVLDPIIENWTIDLKTFAMKIVLNPLFTASSVLRYEYAETFVPKLTPEEPGFEQFLRDNSLSGDATEAEVSFLRSLRFTDRRPSPIYFYRELQNLRDPLHFSR